MNVFSFRNRIIEDYSGYVSSFISIAQPRLRTFVDRCFASGSLWPDPLIQLNPTFKAGNTVDKLVKQGVLEPGCSQVFRREKTSVVGSGDDLLFHQHHARPCLAVSMQSTCVSPMKTKPLNGGARCPQRAFVRSLSR